MDGRQDWQSSPAVSALQTIATNVGLKSNVTGVTVPP
jgi:hypothetical protein